MLHLPWMLSCLIAANPLGSGDHQRAIEVEGQTRSYLVHVPPKEEPAEGFPVVMLFHGALMNARVMVRFCGMNAKADEAGFVAVYPNGTGLAGLFPLWNAGNFRKAPPGTRPDDVAFVRCLLDDLAKVIGVDTQRVYASGISNGAMMCYRLAAEMPERIAAIAPVAGTMAVDDAHGMCCVSVIHFHGTDDIYVPFDGLGDQSPKNFHLKSVSETIRFWVQQNGCPDKARVVEEPDIAADGTRVERRTYGPGRKGAEVVLLVIEGGGHTWPGMVPTIGWLGRSTKDISANDLIWDFFRRHPKKAAVELPAAPR